MGFGTPERKRSRSPASSGLGGDDDQFPDDDDEERSDEQGTTAVDSVTGLSGFGGIGSMGVTPMANQGQTEGYASAGPVSQFTTSQESAPVMPQFTKYKTVVVERRLPFPNSG